MAARINNGGQPTPYEDVLERERAAYYTRQGRAVPPRKNPIETTARALNTKPTTINRRPHHGWPAWCVPVSILVEFIDAHKDFLTSEWSPPQFGTDEVSWSQVSNPRKTGWLELLAARTSRTMKCNHKTMIRNLYRIIQEQNPRPNVVGAELADAICLAVGKDINDTSLPVLPGNKAMAQNLIAIRAEHHGIELDDLDVMRYARQTQRISWLIVGYPHHLEQLLDLAPLNCLRNCYR